MTDGSRPGSDFDGRPLGRHLLRTVRAGALATLDREAGFPFASLATVATDHDGSPLLLLSRLSAHTLNLEADPRCSILLAETGKGDPLAHSRLTVTGTLERATDARVRSRFLNRHPKATLYADFPDFSFWRLNLTGGHLNGGFARAATLGADDLKTGLDGAEALLKAEHGALEHLNDDHRDALILYATCLAGAPPGPWTATGIDPDGLDLLAGDKAVRVLFETRVTEPGALRKVLKTLADRARAESGLAGSGA